MFYKNHIVDVLIDIRLEMYILFNIFLTTLIFTALKNVQFIIVQGRKQTNKFDHKPINIILRT